MPLSYRFCPGCGEKHEGDGVTHPFEIRSCVFPGAGTRTVEELEDVIDNAIENDELKAAKPAVEQKEGLCIRCLATLTPKEASQERFIKNRQRMPLLCTNCQGVYAPPKPAVCLCSECGGHIWRDNSYFRDAHKSTCSCHEDYVAPKPAAAPRYTGPGELHMEDIGGTIDDPLAHRAKPSMVGGPFHSIQEAQEAMSSPDRRAELRAKYPDEYVIDAQLECDITVDGQDYVEQEKLVVCHRDCHELLEMLAVRNSKAELFDPLKSDYLNQVQLTWERSAEIKQLKSMLASKEKMNEIYTDYTRGEFKRLDKENADLKAELATKDKIKLKPGLLIPSTKKDGEYWVLLDDLAKIVETKKDG